LIDIFACHRNATTGKNSNGINGSNHLGGILSETVMELAREGRCRIQVEGLTTLVERRQGVVGMEKAGDG
jgi:hypothetical protein